MEEKRIGANTSAEEPAPQKNQMISQDPNMASTEKASAMESAASTAENTLQAATTEREGRKVYGTAKTENLRDSGLWRFILPAFVAVLCLGLLAVPLIILIPLLTNSLDVNAAANKEHISLTWLWITMIVIEVGLAAVIIWGLLRIFMTQAGNYHR